MQPPVLKIDGLTRRFGSVVANDGIDLEVHAGQVVGLLGHNGAGKTTLVQQVIGLLRPDSGSIRVAGIDAVANPGAARHRIGIQSQSQAPLDGLTPATAISLVARLRGLSRSQAKAATTAIADQLDIGQWMSQRALPEGGGLSGGVRRLTSFAMAVVAPVPLVILDEPTNDVDAARRKLLWNTLRTLADRGMGILLVTHNVVEAERVVDELVVLDSGKVVGSGTPSQLRGTEKEDLRLELVLATNDEPALSASTNLRFNRRVKAGRRLLLTIDSTHALDAVAWASALHADGRIDDYSLTQASLEDAYLAITTGSHSTGEQQ
ncbi:MAG: ABC transporter ATP-binding protein [Actinomycetaceae bacterium]|nr:ABC transporter ATP-binding protein [Actinomycetaceae bacterium]